MEVSDIAKSLAVAVVASSGRLGQGYIKGLSTNFSFSQSNHSHQRTENLRALTVTQTSTTTGA